MKVIFSVINRSLDVMTELNLKNIILEIDRAIYTKILDAMFRMELDGSMIFDKIIMKNGRIPHSYLHIEDNCRYI